MNLRSACSFRDPTRFALATLFLGLFCTSSGQIPGRAESPAPGATVQAAGTPAGDHAKQIENYLSRSFEELGYTNVTITVKAETGNYFGVILSGTLPAGKQASDAGQLVRHLADSRHLANLDLYTAGLKPVAAPKTPEPQLVKRVPLFFFRKAEAIKGILDGISKNSEEGNPLKGLTVQSAGDELLILEGGRETIRAGEQVIAAIDLPVPGVQMNMWGVQISGRDPRKMAEAAAKIRRDIDQAKLAVRDVYRELQYEALTNLPPEGHSSSPQRPWEPGSFGAVLTQDLGYEDALSASRPLSITDILLRMIAASPEANVKFAEALRTRLGRDTPFLRKWDLSIPVDGRRSQQGAQPPFFRLFTSRGMEYSTTTQQWDKSDLGPLTVYNLQARESVLNFTLNYADLVHDSNAFSPYSLEQTEDTLGGRLQIATDAMNQDLFDLVIEPTLRNIQRDVEGVRDVEYSQVGGISVATLSGVPTKVTGSSVSTFDSGPPLQPFEVLKDASATPTAGVPQSQLISLLSAAAKDRTVWRELSQGISLEITPSVLRNATSAELAIHLTVGDPQSATLEAGVPPLSRVSKHDVEDKVDLSALDVFALSTFFSEATLKGGRAYAPIVGPIWHGVFGDLPVLGDLFSWKKSPKHVYHQSVLFTTTIISPTAMGLALLYPNEVSEEWNFDAVKQAVADYSLKVNPRLESLGSGQSSK